MSYIKNYLESLKTKIDNIPHNKIEKLTYILKECKSKKKSIFIFGNGGSASIASHISTDLNKIYKIKSRNFNEANHITCFSNDYGYAKWIEKTLEIYTKKNDVVILISSSGKSKNILNAAQYCKNKGIKLITFSGFSSKNLLKSTGYLNFWVNSSNYNIVENVHQIMLLTAIDKLGKTKY